MIPPNIPPIVFICLLVIIVIGIAVWCFPPDDIDGKYIKKEKLAAVVRVLYAETAGCTDEERGCIMDILLNRVANEAFDRGRNRDIYDAAYQPGQFACVDDRTNINWVNPDYASREWFKCEALVEGGHVRQDTEAVYFHNKSKPKPADWDNQWYRTYVVRETEHFRIYGIRRRDR